MKGRWRNKKIKDKGREVDTRRDEWQEALNKIEWCLPCENQNTEIIAGIEDEESEEMSPITQIRNVKLPSAAEVEEHNLTHLPFRDWCAFYIQGKAVSHAHKKRRGEEPEVLVISMDYMGLAHREP